jgi:hypothetical protein
MSFDPNNPTDAQYRRLVRAANHVKVHHEHLRADAATTPRVRADAFDDAPIGDVTDEPTDWRDGACKCACRATSRGPDGALKRSDDCTCTRVAGVRVDEHGDPKLNIEPCDPNEKKARTTMGHRHDANDDTIDLNALDDVARVDALARLASSEGPEDRALDALRAQREAVTRDAWRGDAAERPRNSEAIDNANTRGTQPKGRIKAIRDQIRVRFGDPSVKKTDVRDLVRAKGGSADFATMNGDGFRSLLADVRKRRAAAEALLPATNTDTGDDPDRALAAARAARDAHTLRAGR